MLHYVDQLVATFVSIVRYWQVVYSGVFAENSWLLLEAGLTRPESKRLKKFFRVEREYSVGLSTQATH